MAEYQGGNGWSQVNNAWNQGSNGWSQASNGYWNNQGGERSAPLYNVTAYSPAPQYQSAAYQYSPPYGAAYTPTLASEVPYTPTPALVPTNLHVPGCENSINYYRWVLIKSLFA